MVVEATLYAKIRAQSAMMMAGEGERKETLCKRVEGDLSPSFYSYPNIPNTIAFI
jgi:hypothetical protein